MGHNQAIREVAALLVEKHGAAAIDVARAKARGSLANGDPAGVATWTAVVALVVAAVEERAAVPADRPPREPPLSDLLDDPVTEAVMKGDGVEREELDAVIDEAKERLDRE
jgi:hypothetical protein